MPPIWKGALTFGLVHIPVQLHSAVRSSERISFRLLHADDLAPIKYERVCSKEGETVPWSDIVKGYEYTKGKFVVLTDEDFKAAEVDASRMLEILDFVREEEIDPRLFDTPYYIAAQRGGEKPYALLREAIRKTGMVGVGTFAMRQKQQLASVRAVGPALMLHVLRFPKELVDPAEMSFPEGQVLRPQELQMAEQLIGNLAEPFDPSKYGDAYHESLMKIIRAKMKGRKIEVDEPAAEDSSQIVDLMARLQESLDQGKRLKETRGGGKQSTADGAGAPAKRRKARTARKSA